MRTIRESFASKNFVSRCCRKKKQGELGIKLVTIRSLRPKYPKN